ncbi:MAG: Ldh family oxidoreductase [Lachnospiraceae bacterium]|nr:Ldh family oxidoreductase [Lachnospiraceae bacterium]
MGYFRIDYAALKDFCEKVFAGYGFSEEESRTITDVLLAADLSAIESHGVQRLIRYHDEITSGMVDLHAVPEVVKDTPLTAVIDGHDAMGQVLGVRAMKLAIEKAKTAGVGMVAVRNSNHYGIAGYYTKMAVKEGLIGICMTNTEAIMVPTFGKQAMLGTNPIAFAMPAEPVPFSFDSATTVVPRGKLEVYAKKTGELRPGWAVDENGRECTDAGRVLQNIIAKSGGGILPLGGAGEEGSGYKGYGYGMLCEICTAILSGGTTSNYVYKNPPHSNIAHFFMAVDYGMFGEKAEIEKRLSVLMQELRDSAKAEGQDRIFTHGEKEILARERILKEGVPVLDKTYEEMRMIAAYTHTEEYLPAADPAD